jgi:hypothetical protein
MASRSYLTEWYVAVVGGGVTSDEAMQKVGESLVPRAQRAMTDKGDRYSINTLLQPKDEGIDLDDESWASALEYSKRIWNADPARKVDSKLPTEPSRLSMRRIRGLGSTNVEATPERGLLLIYLIDRAVSLNDAGDLNSIGDNVDPIVSFGCSFPENENSTKFKYEANNVFWENEYGS